MMMNEVPPFGLDPVKFQKAKRIFCTAAFGILGGFGGVGVAWLVIAALATRGPVSVLTFDTFCGSTV
jgi:hypothetical protein